MRVWATLLLVLAGGCGFLKPTKSQIFTIETQGPSAPTTAVTGVPIGIDTVELPPGFDRKEIVVLKDDRQLDVRGTQQWAAPLESMVLHTVAHNLARRLPNGMVVLPGQSQPAAMRSIDLVFEQLTAGPENAIVADVRWTLRQGAAITAQGHEQVTATTESLDSGAVAAGMSNALGQIADRLAAAVR
jgi:uncharacterized lipoprotein YmbA